ncbi:unnamed protein product [Symbiodinium sp. CCMP2592]|nr:unnamed protein product [Symbiodinium sp. CCMP2592]
MAQPVPVPHDAGEWNGKWGGAAAASNGTIFCTPCNERSFLEVHSGGFDGGRHVSPVDLPEDYQQLIHQSDAFAGGCCTSDGRIYLVPTFFNNRVGEPYLWTLSYAPATGEFQLLNTEGTAVVQELDEESVFWSIAVAPNGKLYSPPANGSQVAVLDPDSGTFELIRGVQRRSQKNKWTGIATAGDHYMFCSPGRARAVLVIDSNTHELHYLWDGELFDEAGAVQYVDEDGDPIPDYLAADVQLWSGIAAAHNSKLYCAPCDADCVLVIDPGNWKLYTLGLNPPCVDSTSANKWSGICLAEDGRLYCAPSCAGSILVIDPVCDAIGYISIAGLDPWQGWQSSGDFKWSGIAAACGRIWCVPDRADALLTMLTPKPPLCLPGHVGVPPDVV